MNRKLLCLILFIFISVGSYAQVLESDSTQFENELDSTEMVDNEGMVTDDFVVDSLAEAFIFWMFPTYKAEIPAKSIYFIWDNDRINPYNFSPNNFVDSVKITVADFSTQEFFIPPIRTFVTSDYGPRWHQYHFGIDLHLRIGDTVVSAFDGVVRIVRVSQGYGNVVVIRHNNGLETVYGHLSKHLVYPNQEVKAGQPIALGGNTGRSTGPHLHFETRYLGIPINPRDFIDFSTFTLKSNTSWITERSFRIYKAGLACKGKYGKYPKKKKKGKGAVSKSKKTSKKTVAPSKNTKKKKK